MALQLHLTACHLKCYVLVHFWLCVLQDAPTIAWLTKLSVFVSVTSNCFPSDHFFSLNPALPLSPLSMGNVTQHDGPWFLLSAGAPDFTHSHEKVFWRWCTSSWEPSTSQSPHTGAAPGTIIKADGCLMWACEEARNNEKKGRRTNPLKRTFAATSAHCVSQDVL